MSDFDDNNRGQIWKNDSKTTDKHPDFKGSLKIDGVEYWVSAWKRKEGANPKAPALSFSVKQKESKQSISELAVQAIKKPDSYAAATGREDPISSGPLDRNKDGFIPF